MSKRRMSKFKLNCIILKLNCLNTIITCRVPKNWSLQLRERVRKLRDIFNCLWKKCTSSQWRKILSQSIVWLKISSQTILKTKNSVLWRLLWCFWQAGLQNLISLSIKCCWNRRSWKPLSVSFTFNVLLEMSPIKLQFKSHQKIFSFR